MIQDHMKVCASSHQIKRYLQVFLLLPPRMIFLSPAPVFIIFKINPYIYLQYHLNYIMHRYKAHRVMCYYTIFSFDSHSVFPFFLHLSPTQSHL